MTDQDRYIALLDEYERYCKDPHDKHPWDLLQLCEQANRARGRDPLREDEHGAVLREVREGQT